MSRSTDNALNRAVHDLERKLATNRYHIVRLLLVSRCSPRGGKTPVAIAWRYRHERHYPGGPQGELRDAWTALYAIVAPDTDVGPFLSTVQDVDNPQLERVRTIGANRPDNDQLMLPGYF